MEATASSSKSKHKRSHNQDRDSSSRKRAKHKHHSKKSSKKNEDHLHVLDADVDDEDDRMPEETPKDDFDSATDFFSMLGSETRRRKQPPHTPDPDQVWERSLRSNCCCLLRLSLSADEDQLQRVECPAEGREVA